MYDRSTDTLWHSLTGKPVVGELANSGIELSRRPVTVTTWAEWLEQYPDTTVVDINTGYNRRYFDPSEQGSAYYEYRASPTAMFPIISVDGRLPEKSNVVGLSFDGAARAYPLDVIITERVIDDALGGAEVVITGHPLAGVTGVFESNGIEFSKGDDHRELIDHTGMIWTIGDDGLTAEDGSTLPRIPAREMFWFAWTAFFPATEVYGE